MSNFNYSQLFVQFDQQNMTLSKRVIKPSKKKKRKEKKRKIWENIKKIALNFGEIVATLFALYVTLKLSKDVPLQNIELSKNRGKKEKHTNIQALEFKSFLSLPAFSFFYFLSLPPFSFSYCLGFPSRSDPAWSMNAG